METDFIPCRPEFLTKDWLMMVLNQYRSLKEQSLIRWLNHQRDYDKESEFFVMLWIVIFNDDVLKIIAWPIVH